MVPANQGNTTRSSLSTRWRRRRTSLHILLLLPLALWPCELVVPVSAQDTPATVTDATGGIVTSIDCTLEKATECVNVGNRSCYEGSCVGCLEDFVELPEEVLDLEEDAHWTEIVETLNMTKAGTSNGTICAPVDALTTALFERVFVPYWQEELDTEQRLTILLEVARYISQENAKNGPNATYTLALNEFSADSPEEAQKLAGYVLPSDGNQILEYLIQQELDTFDSEQDEEEFPPAVDWVELGAVTSVKNQGRCGGCWSISTVGALEGAAAIWSNFTYLQSLSFQQLISCDKTNNGCNGGFPAAAIRYANDNLFGGTATLNDYPFTDEEGTTTTDCKVRDHEVAVQSQLGRAIVYYGNVGDTTYDIRMRKMKQGLSRQPVAIAVKSLCNTWKNYKSGVVTDDGGCACKPTDPEPCLDHAVLLVGYDDNHNPPYWKIKNSWGTGWGEEGYIRVAQFNPHDPDPNSWGLFGLLAEGVVPLQAFNQTQQVYDEPQTIGGMEIWQFVLLLIALVGVCCCGMACVMAIFKGWCGCRKQE